LDQAVERGTTKIHQVIVDCADQFLRFIEDGFEVFK